LDGLITAALTACQQTQLGFLPAGDPPVQPHHKPECAAFTETGNGLKPPAQLPGFPGQDPELKSQSNFPAGWMRPCRCREMANRGRSVMAGGRSSIRACKDQQTPKTKHREGRLQKGVRTSESIEIDQIKEGPIEIGLPEKTVRCLTGGPQGQTRYALKRLKIRLQQGAPVWIRIVGPELDPAAGFGQGLKTPTKTTDAATGHEIEPAQRPLCRCRLIGCQQHRQIP